METGAGCLHPLSKHLGLSPFSTFCTGKHSPQPAEEVSAPCSCCGLARFPGACSICCPFLQGTWATLHVVGQVRGNACSRWRPGTESWGRSAFCERCSLLHGGVCAQRDSVKICPRHRNQPQEELALGTTQALPQRLSKPLVYSSSHFQFWVIRHTYRRSSWFIPEGQS